jgi:hypothetical protein
MHDVIPIINWPIALGCCFGFVFWICDCDPHPAPGTQHPAMTAKISPALLSSFAKCTFCIFFITFFL